MTSFHFSEQIVHDCFFKAKQKGWGEPYFTAIVLPVSMEYSDWFNDLRDMNRQ